MPVVAVGGTAVVEEDEEGILAGPVSVALAVVPSRPAKSTGNRPDDCDSEERVLRSVPTATVDNSVRSSVDTNTSNRGW